jgi:signal transduction histidine kinase
MVLPVPRAAQQADLAEWETRAEFLAVVSHRLRTPLTVVLGYTELLADGISGPLTPTQRDHLARVQASGHELLQILDDLVRSADAGTL